MKYKLQVNPNLTEDLVTIDARKRSSKIEDLVRYIKGLNQRSDSFTVRKDGEVYVLANEVIYNLIIENRKLMIKTERDDFQSHLRLYQAIEQLPRHFIKISQSEVVNLDKLDHMELTGNGLIKIYLKNGYVTFSSRRYLNKIKEVLGL